MSVILATAGYDHKIRFWEAPSGICSRVLKYPDSQVNKLEITPDKQFLAAGGNPHIRIYEIADGSTPSNVVGSGSGGGSGGGGGGSPGGGGPGTSSSEQQQHQQQPVLTLEGHTSSVTSLGFQRDGRYLYSGSEDGTIKLWDLRNPTYSRSFDAKAPVRSVTLRVDKDEIISGDANGMVKIWDLSGSGNTTTTTTRSTTTTTSNNIGSTPTSSSTINNNNENIAGGGNNNNNNASSAAAANNRGTTTATKNSSTSSSKKSKGLIHSLQPADGYTGGCLLQTSIQAVDISEDSRTLVAVSNHGTVYVWDPSTLDSISNSSTAAAAAAAVSQSIKGLSSTTSTTEGPEGSPIIGNNTNPHQSQPALITKFRSHPQPGSYCLHARISPDCRTLCTTGSDGSAKLWDTTTWKLSQNLHQHSKWVWDAAFCADSSYLVTASSDTTARLWNLRSGEVVRQYHGHQSAVTCVALNDSSV